MIIYNVGYIHNIGPSFEICDEGEDVASIESWLDELGGQTIIFGKIEVAEDAIAFCRHGYRATAGKVYRVENSYSTSGWFYFYVVE